MKILLTNDDGLHAAQLVPFIKWCQKLGEVTTVVPKYEQSGKSHSIEIHKPFEVKKVALAPDVEIYTVDSSPADCVRFAFYGLRENYDLVISGVNRGLNVGLDMIYSGTVGAIFEAACFDVPAIALSTVPETFDEAIAQLDNVWDFFTKHELLKKHSLYNVNIPLNPKGIRITQQGKRYYADDFIPQENDMYMPRGKDVFEPSKDPSLLLDTDAALHDGYISISPLTLCRTDMNVFNELKILND